MISRRSAVTRSAALAASLLLACSRGGDEAGRQRVFSPDEKGPAGAPAAFDWSRPLSALELGADDVAARIGSFEWTAGVEWSVSREGEDAQLLHVVERHRIRQSSTGEIAVESEIDPGLGAGSASGKDMVYAGGMTYGRSRPAPFRERPTDRGRDARRYRDETFRVARSVALLCGGALVATDSGGASVLGRPARRYRLALVRDEPARPAAARPAGAPEPDPDTKRRLAFLGGRIPVSLDGELVLDESSGAPLRARMTAAFAVKDQPAVRATVELLAQVKATGGNVPAVVPPKGALPDARKPAGVAAALEAAGLKKAGEEKPGREEPSDD